jgi:hypothetical protein
LRHRGTGSAARTVPVIDDASATGVSARREFRRIHVGPAWLLLASK